jgi:hypothetical protein
MDRAGRNPSPMAQLVEPSDDDRRRDTEPQAE